MDLGGEIWISSFGNRNANFDKCDVKESEHTETETFWRSEEIW